MPLSDNLYSANDDEFDAESFSDDLSPSDGYFRGQMASPRALVPDPSLECPPEAKTLIAGRNTEALIEMNSRANLSPVAPHDDPSVPDAAPPQRSMTSSSSSDPKIYSPQSPSFSRPQSNILSHHSPSASHSFYGPPPAYSPSPTSPTSPPEGLPSGRSYGTFSTSLLDQGLPTGSEPQSMGGQAEGPGERTPLSSHPIRIYSSRRRTIGKILLVALFLSIITAFLTMFARERGHPPSFNPTPSLPIDSPWDQMRPYCRFAAASYDTLFEFPVDRGLSVVQTLNRDEKVPRRNSVVTTAGEIRLRKLPGNPPKGSHGYIRVSYNVSHPNLVASYNWDMHQRALTFSTPRDVTLDIPSTQCISVDITVWLPDDAELSDLTLETVTLSLRVAPDVKAPVSGPSRFSTVSGAIYFPNLESSSASGLPISARTESHFDEENKVRDNLVSPLSSRVIDIGTISGNIQGTYPLYDYLNISSISGSILVDIAPQPAAQSGEFYYADLAIQTVSGNINAKLPLPGPQNPGLEIIPREYITHVESQSGALHGSFYLGIVGNFETTSGDINFTALPVITRSSAIYGPLNTFITKSTSGRTTAVILDPVFLDIAQSPPPDQSRKTPAHDKYESIGDNDPYVLLPPITDRDVSIATDTKVADQSRALNIHGSHEATWGNIKLQYPTSWEGIVTAQSVTGDISIHGKDVQIIKEKNGWGSKEVVARKGDVQEGDKSVVEIGNVAGRLEFVVSGDK